MTAIIASNTQHEDTYISFYSHFSKYIREKSSVETELIKTSSYKQEQPYLKNERLPKVDIFNISRYTVKGQIERAYLRRAIRDAIRDLQV